MSKDLYFDPYRPTHFALLQFLEGRVGGPKDNIEMIKFGKRTQHIFTNGHYVMSINWGLV